MVARNTNLGAQKQTDGETNLLGKPQIETDLSDANVFDRGIPQDAFAEIRATDGLVWNNVKNEPEGSGFWSVGRFDDITAISQDTKSFSSAKGHIQMYNIDEDALEARASMIDMDPPEHSRLRKLVTPGFLPKSVKEYIPIVRNRTTAILDAMVAKGGGDWVKSVSKPIPIGVICDILGVPEEDHDLMIELTDYLVAGTSAEPLDPTAYGNTTPLRLLPFNSPAAHGLRKYAGRLAELRRSDPRDDLVTKLVNAEIDGEHLTMDEVTNFFRLFIFAGNETTRTAMSHLALQMEQFPEEFAKVKADPLLMRSAVEEIVRYSSPILYFRRTATKDTELSGTKVSKGDRLVMWYASGNFDETRFENAQKFDVTRSRLTAHAGYGGGGVHVCLGAGFARMELTVLLEEIFRRDLKIKTVGEPEYVNTNFVNGIEHLEVLLG